MLLFQEPQVAAIPHSASLLHESSHHNGRLHVALDAKAFLEPGGQEQEALGGRLSFGGTIVNPLMAGLVLVIQVVKWVLTFLLFILCASCLKLNT